jgi:hypothetical protein
MANPQLVCNRIITPDGTVLQSYHRHDYKVYTDKNGREYMVDGGLDYTRRIIHDDAPYTEFSLTVDDPFEDIRQGFAWGTRGKDGKKPLTWVPLCELTTDHIFAILETQDLTDWLAELFEKELEYRVECDV